MHVVRGKAGLFACWLGEQEDLRPESLRELSGRRHLPVFEIGDYVFWCLRC